jgi:hypothetical protein
MAQSIDIFANMVISYNGEDMAIAASEKRILVTLASIPAGLRTLLSLEEQYNLSKHIYGYDAVLRDRGWTIFACIGPFKLAVLGSRAWINTFRAIFLACRASRLLKLTRCKS